MIRKIGRGNGLPKHCPAARRAETGIGEVKSARHGSRELIDFLTIARSTNWVRLTTAIDYRQDDGLKAASTTTEDSRLIFGGMSRYSSL
ncbi:MAG: hypothetical protein WB810_12180 [Candidatus Cybelea sp.]